VFISSRRSNHGRGLLWAALTAVITLLVSVLSAAPASAAPAAPSNLSPSSSVSTNTPVLSWARVKGAASYNVEVSSSSSFSSALFSTTTTNRRAVPTTALPDGVLHWRVRGVTRKGAAGTWATRSFSINSVAPPSILSPTSGQKLAQPNDPPLLSWTAVAGATKYHIEHDTEPGFIGAKTYSTETTSFVIPDAGDPGTYYWRVRAERTNRLTTKWSTTGSYVILPLKNVVTRYPADNADTSIKDVYLDWNPVPGATKYEVRVSTDRDFNTLVGGRTITVLSTRYSPPTTYLNNQYYWQVRALNVAGKATDWTPVPATFRRHWPEKPTLQFPADGINPAVSDDFYYQWTPVQHATRYQLDVGDDPNFSPGSFATCYTTGTTYAAGYLRNPGDKCMPSGQGSIYHWRVRALDDPAGVQGIYSTIRSFIYDSGEVVKTAPANGATVAVPTLQWKPSREAERYYVEVKDSGGVVVAKTTTYSLSWTPTGKNGLNPAKGPFTWTVQAYDTNAKTPSPKYPGWSFSLAGDPETSSATPLTPLSGTAADTPTVRFPNLTWEPLDGAAYYRVSIGNHNSPYYFDPSYTPFLKTDFKYPAATDNGDKMLLPGKYDWAVQAFDSSGSSLGYGPRATFTISDLPPVSGQRIAVNGTSLDAGKACTAFLDDPSSSLDICSGVPTTPVLDWEPIPGASHYMIYLAQDREFTNMVYAKIPETTNTRWTPTWASSPKALADSQAGKAYYWFVRPCKADGYCAPDPISTNKAATHAFDKKSPPVKLLSPAHGGTAANDVTFTWEDYKTTNDATVYAASGETSNQTAKQYRIQVSTTPTFTSLLENRLVDQATFTPFDRTYPEGTLYWRVQAVDGQGNALTWSATRKFTKSSPSTVLRSPVGGASTNGLAPFRWQPTDFAASYRLEVYKNGDTALSAANRVIGVTSKQTAYSPPSPLPASSAAYLWRVQRIDASGNPGQWSSLGRFYSRGAAPTLTAPSQNAYVSPRDALFSWGAVPAAVSYRFERKLSGSTSLTENVTTQATAWAPTKPVENGSWQWRVTAYDLDRNTLGTSAWRTLNVDTVRPRVVKKSPVKKAKRTANFVAKFSEPVRNVNRTTMKLFVKGRQDPLKARVTLSKDRTRAVLNPRKNLQKGKVYILRISTGVRDDRGNKLRAASWRARSR
jgi:hypothetical protein